MKNSRAVNPSENPLPKSKTPSKHPKPNTRISPIRAFYRSTNPLLPDASPNELILQYRNASTICSKYEHSVPATLQPHHHTTLPKHPHANQTRLTISTHLTARPRPLEPAYANPETTPTPPTPPTPPTSAYLPTQPHSCASTQPKHHMRPPTRRTHVRTAA